MSGLELAISKVPCVVKTCTGYAGGDISLSPTYYNLSTTGDAEAVLVTYNPDDTDIFQIIDVFLAHSIGDPSPESNPRYFRAIEVNDPKILMVVSRYLDARASNILVRGKTRFVAAEAYHQGYYKRVLDV